MLRVILRSLSKFGNCIEVACIYEIEAFSEVVYNRWPTRMALDFVI